MAITASSYFPRQDINQKDKDDNWLSAHLNYAEFLLTTSNNDRVKMTNWFNGYLGNFNPEAIKWITARYGKENLSKYRPWRLGKTKVDTMQGEQLKRPMVATVTTINSQSVNNKIEQMDFIRGAMIARSELETIKNVAGVDVLEGMEIPETETDFEKMSFKDKCEVIMQLITNNQILDLDVKKKVSDSFLHAILTNRCNAMVEINEKGEVHIHVIDPRDAIYEPIQGDDYLEESPIRGCRRTMSIHQVLLRYPSLTKDQRDLLDSIRKSPMEYIGSNSKGRGYIREGANNELLCDVIHIEWDSVRPVYTKIVKKTKSQYEADPSDEYMRLPMEAEAYEGSREIHEKRIKAGEYTIETKWVEEKYEATRIGGCIDINMRRVLNKKRSVDNPSRILSTTYVGYIHGRLDGQTVPLQEILNSFDALFDVVQYMKLRELVKMKGKILTIDRAGLGLKENLEDLMHRASNDQVIDWNSAAAGNAGGRPISPADMFKEFDLGLSDSFAQLLAVEQNIIANLDQITGINPTRQGITAASATATAQQSDLANSRNITEALFYGFSGFVKRLMMAVVNKSAVSWAYYKQGKAEQILGTEKFYFLKSTVELAERDYGVHIEDGGRYMEISQKIESLMEFMLNSKEIRPMDALNIITAETMAEKRNILKTSWETLQQIAMQQQQADNEAAAAMNEQNLATQIQIAQENREDLQVNEKENIALKGQVQIAVDNNKAQNDAQLQHQKIQGEIIKNTTTDE